MQAKYLLVLLGTFLLGQCANNMSPSRQTLRELSKAETQILQADNMVGLELMRTLNTGMRDSNVVISPLSISMALGMTLNGARGTTQEAMRSALKLQGMSEAEINAAYRGMMDLLAGLDPNVKFQVANSIWYRSGFQARPAFLDLNRQFFDAEVSDLDFSSPGAAKRINGWVDSKTEGRISSIVPEQIAGDLMMYLINAIYFKAAWSTKFDPAKTREADFFRPDGSVVRCSMMNRNGEVSYFHSASYSAVDLPYGDGDFSMTVLLPAESSSADALLESLSPEDWNGLPSKFTKQEVPVSLPKFTIRYGRELNDALKALGMGIAFSSSADLSGIAGVPGELYISEVQHKTFIEVNEEGTEAAAATSVGITRMSLGPSMIANRPFIFAIREKNSGAVLFIGKIADPTQG